MQRAIGPYRAREVSLTAAPLDAQTAEKWGLVNRVVPPSELLGAARGIAEAILKNQNGLVLKYKAVINDGFKLPLGEALKLEQVYLQNNIVLSARFLLFHLYLLVLVSAF